MNARQFVVDWVALETLLTMDVSKYAIAFAFADVEGLPISGIDESVHVIVELVLHLRRKPEGSTICYRGHPSEPISVKKSQMLPLDLTPSSGRRLLGAMLKALE